jgi:hypothetical protein
VIGAGGVGVTAQIGLTDGTDGVYFEMSGTSMGVVVRKANVDNRIEQADWSIDALDGNGVSSITMDFSKTQIFVIDFEWLGVGTVRFGLVNDGGIIYFHEEMHANILTAVYTSTPNLPVRYRVTTTDATAELMHICASVMSEAGLNVTGITRSASTDGTHVDADVANTIYAVMGLRLKSTHLDAMVVPISMGMLTETDDDFEWMLLVNPTVGGTFAYGDEVNSCCQTARGATANTIDLATAAAKLDGGWANGGGGATGGSFVGDVHTSLKLGANIDGTPDEFVLAVRPLSASADIQGSIDLREFL